MTDLNTRTEYFRALFQESVDIIGRLPVLREAQPIRYVAEMLEPAALAARPEEAARLRAIPRGAHPVDPEDRRTSGMNTVGILGDRLSILAIKYWNLLHRHNKPEAAEKIRNVDADQIVRALAEARPGSETLLSKISVLEVDIHDADWAECYYGLIVYNLLMWEAQETMYLTGLDGAEPDELRALIRWASYGNLRRNHFISRGEILYWQSA